MVKKYLILLLVVCATACKREDRRPALSFYYWRTTFQLNERERATLTINQVSTLYIRYFDVALKGGSPVPRSAIQFLEKPGIAVVPVIYIKNEVMLTSRLDATALAQKVLTLVDQISTQQAISYNEIQLDCDWSSASKDTFFQFVKTLKKLSHKSLSATIRLHQVKYFKRAGIPAVDRGVLMYYNMGRIGADSLNSIYEKKSAAPYLASLKDYPLKLDVAFPIFSWGLQIRNNKVIALLNKVDAATFIGDSSFVNKGKPNFFKSTRNIEKEGHYFQVDDVVKIESMGEVDLREMADEVADVIKTKPGTIIFYDLDNFNLKHFENNDAIFQEVGAAF